MGTTTPLTSPGEVRLDCVYVHQRLNLESPSGLECFDLLWILLYTKHTLSVNLRLRCQSGCHELYSYHPVSSNFFLRSPHKHLMRAFSVFLLEMLSQPENRFLSIFYQANQDFPFLRIQSIKQPVIFQAKDHIWACMKRITEVKKDFSGRSGNAVLVYAVRLRR